MSEFCKGMLTALAIMAAVVVVIMLASCSMHVVNITPGSVNATSAALLYCPEASVIRVQDGNRTVDMLSDESGVGKTLVGIVGGLK